MAGCGGNCSVVFWAALYKLIALRGIQVKFNVIVSLVQVQMLSFIHVLLFTSDLAKLPVYCAMWEMYLGELLPIPDMNWNYRVSRKWNWLDCSSNLPLFGWVFKRHFSWLYLLNWLLTHFSVCHNIPFLSLHSETCRNWYAFLRNRWIRLFSRGAWSCHTVTANSKLRYNNS